MFGMMGIRSGNQPMGDAPVQSAECCWMLSIISTHCKQLVVEQTGECGMGCSEWQCRSLGGLQSSSVLFCSVWGRHGEQH